MASLERIKVVSLGGGSGLSTLLAGLKYISLQSPFQTRSHSLTLKTQPGETDHFSLSDHLRALRRHTDDRDLFDHVLLNAQPVSPKLLKVRHNSVKLAAAVLEIFEEEQEK